MKKRTLLFVALTATGVTPAFAGNDAASPLQQVSYSSAKPAATDNQVRFLSGGVGDENLQAMKAAESEYDLKMVFVNMAHAYLADLDVTVMDPNGNHMFETRTDGPILLANLPAGRYTVIARTDDGITQTKRVDIRAGHQAEYILSYPSI